MWIVKDAPPATGPTEDRIGCLDVHYSGNDTARAACVVFSGWDARTSLWEGVELITGVAPYVPGQFYLRELPCLLAILKKVPHQLTTILVDSYVHLSVDKAPGLGAHLYEALERKIPIVGVAKTHFAGAPATEVRRHSRRPLYVTAVGISEAEAARAIASMHGPFRLPTLLKRADLLSRSSPSSAPSHST